MAHFLHTADWHIGMKAAHSGAAASAIREARYVSAARIIEIARAESIDFILIAGDLFDNHNVSDEVVRRTVAILNAAAPIRIFVIPGNHDHYQVGSVWQRPAWRQAGEHVSLLVNCDPISVAAGVTLFPCPITQKTSSIDPTIGIPTRNALDHGVRIGFAHGSVTADRMMDFPIDPTRVLKSGLDYLALGDWHGYSERVRNTVYPGAHEQTSFADSDSGSVVLVRIDDPGRNPSIQRRRVGALAWYDVTRAIQDDADVAELRSHVDGLGDRSTLVLRLEVTVPADNSHLLERVASLREDLERTVVSLDWREAPMFTPDATASLPDGLFATVDADLNSLSQLDGASFERKDIPDEVIDRARALLRHAAAGGRL